MILKELSRSDRAYIYNEYLVNDFHASEVKSLDLIESLIEDKKYIGYGFYEDEQLLGYTFIVRNSELDCLLIDYLVVISGYRSKGLGSQMIAVLNETFAPKNSCIIAEVENPRDALDEEDKINRERRIEFYLRNGFELSNVETKVSDDKYIIIKLKLKTQLNDDEINESMNKIYRDVFGEEIFKKHIRVSNK